MTLSRRHLLTTLSALLTGRSRPVAFTNPVTGGQGALVRPAIKSPNYAAGSAGWTINRDGSAEFNNLTIRGTFNGTDFVINSSGAFFYSGTPTHGNLIASIANSAGTDVHSNAYPSGILSQLGGADGDAFALLQNGAAFLGQNLSGTQDLAHAGSLQITPPATDLTISSPHTTAQPNAASIELSSSSATPVLTITGDITTVGRITPLVCSQARHDAGATWTSTSYGAASVALSTTAVLPASGKALVRFAVKSSTSTAGDNVLSDLLVSGSTSGTLHSPSDTPAIITGLTAADGGFTVEYLIAGVAGETLTATAQHRVAVAGSTGTATSRSITIQTLPA